MIGWLRAAAPLAAVAMLLSAPAPARASEPLVAAAASLEFALAEIGGAFERETGHRFRTSFGSSGNLFRQIVQGAPFELFLSADEGFAQKLAEAGLAADDGIVYAEGRIALFAANGSPLRVDPELSDLRSALEERRIRKFAIANPEHAPYGVAAKQALQHQGIWSAVEARLVFGENVAQAAQFAASGSADGGIIAYALALAPAMQERGAHVLLPAAWHAPLRQRMVLIDGASETSRRLYDWLQGATARQILREFGFTTPSESS